MGDERRRGGRCGVAGTEGGRWGRGGGGLIWFSRACRSARGATYLCDPRLRGGRQKRLYCYVGGGSPTEGSTQLAQAIVVRAESWTYAALAVVTMEILAACVPGQDGRDLVCISKDFM